MPLARPSLTELWQRIATDVKARLGSVDPLLRRSNFGVLTRVFAGAAYELHGFLVNVSKQVFPDTADAEFLERWAAVWGVTRKDGAKAAGSVIATRAGSETIPIGASLLRSDGVEFVTIAAPIWAGGLGSVDVEAAVKGAAGDTEAQSVLTFSNPIAGIDAETAVNPPGIRGGADAESDDSLRSRLLSRIQEPPHGGADFDYVTWAKEVSGVTRAWVAPSVNGPGTVGVTFVTDDAETGIVPTSGKVAEVQAYIDDASRRPVGAEVLVFAPGLKNLDPDIELNPDTPEIRAAVIAELNDLIYREGIPGTVLLRTHIAEAISAAAGEVDHVLHAPVGNVALGPGQIPALGTVTWR